MPNPHAAVTDAWAERAAGIRRLWVRPRDWVYLYDRSIPFDGDEAGLDDPEDEACG